MRNKVLSLFLVFWGALHTTVYAQVDTTVYKKVAIEACKCVDTLQFEKFGSLNFDIELRPCIYKELIHFSKELNINVEKDILSRESIFEDNNLRSKSSIVLGFLVRDCPKVFQLLIGDLIKEEEGYKKEEPRREERIREEDIVVDSTQLDTLITQKKRPRSLRSEFEEEVGDIVNYGSTEGKIKRMEQKPYPFLVITDSSGKEQRFIWIQNNMAYIDPILRNYPQNIGERISVNWQDAYWYDPQQKEYELYKAVNYLQILDDGGEVVYKEDYEPENGVIEGTLEKISTKGYTFLIVHDSVAIRHKFLWTQSFNYDNELKANFKAYKGKKVKIDWRREELLDIKTKSLRTFKRVTWVEFIE
jgi:hypothetical protein